MKKNKIFVVTLRVLIALVFMIPLSTAAAQENGFSETFDDSTLPGWERAREAVVIDGVLHMDPGSFALHIGDWSEIDMSFEARFEGEGEMAISYYFRDANRYTLIVMSNALLLEKEQEGEASILSETTALDLQSETWSTIGIKVEGGEHQISLNNEIMLTATDTEPLETGAILLEARGVTAEFDNLILTGTPGSTPPDEEPPPGESQPAEQSQSTANDEVGATSVGSSAPSDQGWAGFITEFFASQATTLELTTFLINLILAAICAYILSLVYIYWGTSLTNRRKFAANFMLMTITTTFIILVVRSSVALSLGLVGALSIVRFRTAVKEPEELAYLFFAIGIGIGLGDNQRLITLLALAAGIIILGLLRLFRRSDVDANLHLTVSGKGEHNCSLEDILQVLRTHCSKVKLLRLDEDADNFEAGFLIELRKIADLNDVRNAIRSLSKSLVITFMDNKGLW